MGLQSALSEASVPTGPLKAHPNNNPIRMGIQIDPCELSIFDYFILRLSFPYQMFHTK